MYEYTCKACGKRFEALVFANERVLCSSCGSARLKKEFSTFAVHQGSRSQASKPGCACGCEGGFERGSCGSGLCGGA